jgi:hypothetical protein
VKNPEVQDMGLSALSSSSGGTSGTLPSHVSKVHLQMVNGNFKIVLAVPKSAT